MSTGSKRKRNKKSRFREMARLRWSKRDAGRSNNNSVVNNNDTVTNEDEIVTETSIETTASGGCDTSFFGDDLGENSAETSVKTIDSYLFGGNQGENSNVVKA